MTDLTPFNYEDHSVRVVTIDGEPWFVAADICAVLEIGDTRKSVGYLDEDERTTSPVIDALGRTQQTYVVNEPGLYSLILRSRKPEAKAFKRWITHEVIPSIRRTGGYGQPQIPGSYAEALEAAARQAREREAAEQRARELEPSAHAWEQLADGGGDYSLRDAAQILDRDPAIRIGQNLLADYLRDIGWTDAGGRPYQRTVNAGRLVQRAIRLRNGKPGHQVRITPKGLRELHARLGGERPLRLDPWPTQLALPA